MVQVIRNGYKDTEYGEIPVDWEVNTLDEVCTLKGRIGWRGYTKDDLRNSGPLVIGATQVNKFNKIDLSNPVYISKEKYEESTEIKVLKWDIILVKTGNTIGKVAIVDKDIGEATINPNTALLKEIKTDNFYLFYLVASDIVQSKIRKSITIGAQPSINQKTLKNILISVPPLPEQQKIADILSTVDEQLEQTDQLIEQTKELKKGLMQKLLTKGIGHTEFKQTELGEIPVEWDVIKVKDISQTTSGGTPSRKIKEYYYDGTIPWVKTGELANKYIYDTEEKITDEAIKKSSAKLLDKNTLLIAMYGATIGKSSILKTEATTNQACCALIPDKTLLDHEYLYYHLKFNKDKLVKLGAGGAQPNISQQIIKDYCLLLPPLPEQQKIADILSSVDEQIEQYATKKQKLVQLKKGLMQKLLTGQIRVNV